MYLQDPRNTAVFAATLLQSLTWIDSYIFGRSSLKQEESAPFSNEIAVSASPPKYSTANAQSIGSL